MSDSDDASISMIDDRTELQKEVCKLGEEYLHWLAESHYLPDEDEAEYDWVISVNGKSYRCALRACIERIE